MFKTYYSVLSLTRASDEDKLTPNFIKLYKQYPRLSRDKMEELDAEVSLLIDKYLTIGIIHHRHIIAAIMETINGADIPKSFNTYLDNFLSLKNFDACQLFINNERSRHMIKMHYLENNNVELFINLLNKAIIELLDNHTMVSLPIFPVNKRDRMDFLNLMHAKRIIIRGKLQPEAFVDTIYDYSDYYSDLSDEHRLGIIL